METFFRLFFVLLCGLCGSLSGVYGQFFGGLGFGFGGLIPNPLAIWAAGGPGIGAQIPDIGLMGMNDDIRILPQQNVPAPAAAASAADLRNAAPSNESTDAAVTADADKAPTDTRSIRKKGGAVMNGLSGGAKKASLLEKQKILNMSISSLAKQILDERSAESARALPSLRDVLAAQPQSKSK